MTGADMLRDQGKPPQQSDEPLVVLVGVDAGHAASVAGDVDHPLGMVGQDHPRPARGGRAAQVGPCGAGEAALSEGAAQ